MQKIISSRDGHRPSTGAEEAWAQAQTTAKSLRTEVLYLQGSDPLLHCSCTCQKSKARDCSIQRPHCHKSRGLSPAHWETASLSIIPNFSLFSTWQVNYFFSSQYDLEFGWEMYLYMTLYICTYGSLITGRGKTAGFPAIENNQTANPPIFSKHNNHSFSCTQTQNQEFFPAFTNSLLQHVTLRTTLPFPVSFSKQRTARDVTCTHNCWFMLCWLRGTTLSARQFLTITVFTSLTETRSPCSECKKKSYGQFKGKTSCMYNMCKLNVSFM